MGRNDRVILAAPALNEDGRPRVKEGSTGIVVLARGEFVSLRIDGRRDMVHEVPVAILQKL